jgi:choline dehydrogenase-like flavoprotein
MTPAPAGFFDTTTAGPPEKDGAADFLIVGSGAGGGAAARALALAGHDVVVLEEGPPFAPQDGGAPLAAATMARYFRHKGQMTAMGPAPIPILQGRCVGGTTAVNSAIVWRLPEAVLARWHREHGLAEGLPAAALEDAFAELEAALAVQPVGDEVATGSDRMMRLAAERAGLAHRPIQRSVAGCQGSGRCFHGCPHDAKQSTAVNFLRRAAERGARVYAHARVERVLRDPLTGRAAAVEGRVDGEGPHRGVRFRLRARRGVILCASVIQTPNLLRRSGICRESEALGAHFMAHPGSTVMGIYPDPVHMWSGAAQGYEITGLRDTLGIKLESINVPPEVLASRLPGAGGRFGRYLSRLHHIAAWAIAVRMDAEGRVLPSRLLGGDRVHYTPTEGDLLRLRQGMKRTAELHFLAGATEVLSGIHGMPEVLTSPDQLRLYDDAPLGVRSYHLVATHLFGTCRAGRDPRTSVVDPMLQAHGVPGLYVMDASVFPSNTGVNPQHSIMAVATVAARRLAAA